MKSCRSFLGFVYLAFCCAAVAQSTNASLTGFVDDPSKAVIQKASVTAINTATGVKMTTLTDKAGQYVITSLPPGSYRIEVDKQGFKGIIEAGLVLHVQDVAQINFHMVVGSMSETVTVNGDEQQINTTDASVSTVIDRHFVENLPLNGRGFNALVELTPGVVTATTGYNAQGQFNINGQRSSSNYFSVDGVSANTGAAAGSGLSQTAAGTTPATNILGGMNAMVSVDALQEFRVMTSTFAPEYGRTPGGQISIATRSGTNQFHGTAFDYFRNDVLDANDWFAKHTGLVRPALRQNDFGGVVGGPIWKGKTFFFFSYEGLRVRQPQTAVNDSVPSVAARQAASSTLQPYLNAFPVPNGANLTNGFAIYNATFSNPASFDATAIRVDHTLGRTNLFARYSYSPSSQASRGGSYPLSDVTTLTMGNWSITGGATSVLSTSVTNEVRLNWTSSHATGRNTLDSFGGAQPLSQSMLLPTAPSPDSSKISINFSGTGALLAQGPSANNSQAQFNAIDNISISKAKHEFKFGLDIRVLRPIVGPPPFIETANFAGIGNPALTQSQQTVGSFLSGIASSGSVSSAAPSSGMRYLNFSSFAQDTWRVSPRLTMTYGLRWDVAPPPTGTNASLYALTGLQSPATIAFAPAGTPLWNTDYKNFAPRFGLAYRLIDSPDHALVLRAGAGIFYDLTGGLIGTQPALAPNVSLISFTKTAFPFSATVATPPALPGNPPYSSVAADPGLTTARVYQWNTAIEQQLGRYGAFSITYVGSMGSDLDRATALFSPNPTFTSLTLLQSNASSNFNSLQAQFNGHLGPRVQLLTSYSWSHSIDNSSGDTISTAPPFSQVGPNSERGSSDFDVSDSFSTAFTVSTPEFKGSLWSVLARNWYMDSIFQARSAFPFNAELLENLGYGSYIFRPNVVSGQPVWIANATAGGGRQVNAAAFMIPNPLAQGNESRNSIRGFGMWQDDLDIRRDFKLKPERLRLQFKLEMFNLFNNPSFANPQPILAIVLAPGVSLSQTTFGLSQSMLSGQLGSGGLNGGLSPLYQVGGPRSGELALKLFF